MKEKWAIKLSAPILALALVSACGTGNDNNDVPQDNNDVPQNNNDPETENQRNDNTRYNEGDMNVPENKKNNNWDQTKRTQ